MLDIQFEGMEKMKKYFDPKNIKKATKVSLNKSAKSGKVAGAKKITEEYTLKAQTVKGAMKLIKAGQTAIAIIKVIGGKIPLIKFKATQVSAGVKVKVRRKRPAKTVKHAFIATMATRGVFKRLTPRRFPTQELKSISIPQVAKTDAVLGAIMKRVFEQLPKEFMSALKFYSRKK